jgi:hypothetical protein
LLESSSCGRSDICRGLLVENGQPGCKVLKP